MGIALVSHTMKGSNASDGLDHVTTDAIDTTGANLIVILLGCTQFGGEGTLADSKSNMWTGLTSKSAPDTGAHARLFYCVNPTVGSGHTFSITSGFFMTLGIQAFSGVKTSSAFDSENGAASNSSNDISTGDVTPSEDGEVVVAGIGSYGDNGSAYSSDTLDITDFLPYTGGDHEAATMAYKVQGSATTWNNRWTCNSAVGQATVIACFKAAPTTVAYTLTADTGYFTLSGQSANLVKSTSPLRRQPSQRFDALPDLMSPVWQQYRRWPKPIVASVDSPLPRPASHRADALVDLSAHWWGLPRPHQTLGRIYLRQSAAGSSTSSPLALAYTDKVMAGDALLVGAWTNSATGGRTVTITDSLGNTWTQVDTYRNANVGDNRFRLSVWYAVANASGVCTVTSTASGSVLAMGLALTEYSGPATPIIDGVVGQDGASSTSWSTGTIPVNSPHEMAVGFFGCETDKTPSFTATGGFVTEINLSIASVSDSVHVIDHADVSAGLAATATISIARGFAAIGLSLFAQTPTAPPTRQASQRIDPLADDNVLVWQQRRLPPVPLSRPPDNPLSQPCYQRFDALPVFNTWWQQLRPWPKPVAGPAPAVDSPLPRQPYQRFDPLVVLETWWEQFRGQPLPLTFVVTPPLPRPASQRFDAQPNFTAAWWEYLEFVRRFPIPSVFPPARVSHIKPFLNRVPSPDPRLRRFSELLSELVNSLMGQGYIQEVATATWRVVGGGIAKARAPGANDDNSTGVNVGSVWVDTSVGKAYICVNATIGAATWSGPF